MALTFSAMPACQMPKDLYEQNIRLSQEAFGWSGPIAPATPPEKGQVDVVHVVALLDGRVVARLEVLDRRIATSLGDVRMAGIGGVCSHPDFRGIGAARGCLLGAQRLFAARYNFGGLFCHQRVHDFYHKLGWRRIDNEILLIRPDGTHGPRVDKPEGMMMIFPALRPVEPWPSGPIDLNGREW